MIPFRLKISAGISAISALVFLVTAFAHDRLVGKLGEDALLEHAHGTASLFASSVETAVLTSDLAAIEEVLGTLLKHPDIAYARVLNAEGVVLSQGGDIEAMARPFSVDNKLQDVDDGVLDEIADIDINGTNFGYVQLGISTKELTAFISMSRWSYALLALGGMVFLILASVLLAYYLTRRLQELETASVHISGGEFGYQLEVKGNDELAHTANAFNAMSLRLREVYGNLCDSEERCRQISETSPVPIFTARCRDGDITYANSAACELADLSHNLFLGSNAADLFTAPDEFENIIQTTYKEGGIRGYEVEVKKPNGETIPTLVFAHLLIMQNQELILISIVDISHERKAQSQIVHASKMATLGEMATGIAHELNQPLNIIRMSAESALDRAGDGELDMDFTKAKFTRIFSQVERASEIIDHMRIFGRKSENDIGPVNPCKAALDASALLREQLRLREIELRLNLAEDCRPVFGVQVHLEQVLMNLIGNARDAIISRSGKGGDTAGNLITMTVEDAPPQNFIRILVTDTGGGIPQNILSRIFEPFFTTKEVGRGTGLGLSVTHGIIKQMGGAIVADNVNGGAQFKITLPVHIAEDERTRASA